MRAVARLSGPPARIARALAHAQFHTAAQSSKNGHNSSLQMRAVARLSGRPARVSSSIATLRAVARLAGPPARMKTEMTNCVSAVAEGIDRRDVAHPRRHGRDRSRAIDFPFIPFSNFRVVDFSSCRNFSSWLGRPTKWMLRGGTWGLT